jgi:septal ring factor EnvC (AmiA/AmiB activator)
VLLASALAWYLFGGGLSNNGSGVDQVRTDLQSTRTEQRQAIERIESITTGLENSESEAGRISEGLGGIADTVTTVEGRINESQSQLTTSADLLREGQRILKQVRERGQVGE